MGVFKTDFADGENLRRKYMCIPRQGRKGGAVLGIF